MKKQLIIGITFIVFFLMTSTAIGIQHAHQTAPSDALKKSSPKESLLTSSSFNLL